MKNLDNSRGIIKAVGNFSTCFNISVHCKRPRNSLPSLLLIPRKNYSTRSFAYKKEYARHEFNHSFATNETVVFGYVI